MALAGCTYRRLLSRLVCTGSELRGRVWNHSCPGRHASACIWRDGSRHFLAAGSSSAPAGWSACKITDWYWGFDRIHHDSAGEYMQMEPQLNSTIHSTE